MLKATQLIGFGARRSAAADFYGAFVKLSGNDARDWRSGVTIPWNGTDDVDVGGWHDPSTDNTRLTVPINQGITRVRILVNVYASGLVATSNITIKLKKNGSETFDNFAINTFMSLVTGFNSGEWILATESMPVSDGDYFEVVLDMGEGDGDASQTLLAANTYAMIEATHRVHDIYTGANVTKSGASTGVDATAGHTLAWDSELDDTGGWHDNVTNNTRLTVPSGVTRVRLYLYLRLANLAGNTVFMEWLKGGSTAYEGYVSKSWRANGSLTTSEYQLVTADIPVTPGDYFEARFICAGDSSIDILASSRAVIEAVEYDYNAYALVTASGTQAGDFTSGQVLTFNTETQDTGSWHDNVTNNTRLTVPSGYNISHVDLTAYVRVSDIQGVANTQQGYIAFRKNGSDTFVGKTAYSQQKSGTELTSGTWHQVLTAYSVPAVAGDYFEVYYLSNGALGSDTSITVNSDRIFQARATRFDGAS